jgi:uncharacterized membrane-anchored protein YjiN (DUF445 family)
MSQPAEQPAKPTDPEPSVLKRYKDELKSYTAGLQRSALFQDFEALLQEAERRRYNTRRFFLVSAAVVIWLAYDSIKKFTANQAAAVTSEYLENPQFKKDVVAFLESPEIRRAVEQLLKASVLELCEEPEVQRRLRELVVALLKSEEVQRQAQEMAAERVTLLLRDPAVQAASGDAAWGAMRRFFGRT